MLVGNEYSGWLVLDIPNVEEGLIILRFFSWLPVTSSVRTEGWTSVNNERSLRQGNSSHEVLLDQVDTAAQGERRDAGGRSIDDLPDTFQFEFSINGKSTKWSKEELKERRGQPQRVVEVVTLLDDPKFPKGPVELGIRLLGCGRDCPFGIPHLYWA